MTTEPTNPLLLRTVESLYYQASAGNEVARDKLRAVGAHAGEGDIASLAALNTLSVVFYQKTYPRSFAKAERMSRLIQAGDPVAIAWASDVQAKARLGDLGSKRILGMLNAIKDSAVASAWAVPTDISGDDDNFRTRNETPMTIGQQPPRAFAKGNLIIGADPSPSTTRRFLKLTPDIEQKLISMMVQGSLSRPASDLRGAATSVDTTDFSSSSSSSSRSSPTASLASRGSAMATLNRGGGATTAQQEAYKNSALTDLRTVVSAGQMLANNNPEMAALRDQHTGDIEWQTGFYAGSVCSMSNAQEGPGQNRFRDEVVITSDNSDVNVRRMQGFSEARRQQYAFTTNATPITLPVVVKSFGRAGGSTPLTDSERAALFANQGICNLAARALARQSPAASNLMAQCAAERRKNVLSGVYIADDLSPNDGAYRVALTEAGEAVVSKNAKMGEFRASLPLGQQRGFTMAMGARAGKVDPKFIAFVTPGLAMDSQLLKGFLDGMKM